MWQTRYYVILLLVVHAADVHRLEQGLGPQHYDAVLLFAEEDQDFAMQMLDRMETYYGLKVLKQE
jgi:myeloid differentiation primary response protein MyD88